MAILVQINASRAVTWKDTSGVVWKSTADVVWKSQDDSGTLYLSLDGEALTHYWDAYIASFSTPCYETAKTYGGYVELSFGNIEISPEAFDDNWPPPKKLTVVIQYTATTEAAAVTLFNGDIYLASFDTESVNYSIHAPKYTQRLLDEGADYDGNTVPYPRAFGTVTHQQPLRVADDGSSHPCYRLSGISTTAAAISVNSFTSSAAGAKTKVTLSASHGWSNGASIIIESSVNFAGTHTIESVSGATFVIPVAYPSSNTEKLPIKAIAKVSGAFTVYDDGVPIQGNVVVNGNDTFSLTDTPVGVVTISGTASYTDLEDVVTWGQSRLGIGSIDTTYQRGTSPSISVWCTGQMPVIDFLSEITAFFTHYFYIKADILYLGDMLLDAGDETLTEYDYIDAGYSAQTAIRQIKASWQTYEAAEGQVNNDSTNLARFIRTIPNTVIQSMYTRSSGTADGTGTRQLIDTGAAFDTDGVEIEDVVNNTTDNTSTTVVAVSGTILELQDDIFVSGETYVVGPSFPYGTDEEVTPYHDTKSNVTTALQNILSVLTKDVAEVRRPISTTLPDPGKKLTFTDTQLVVDTTTWIRARRILPDFENEEVVISGEGVIS